MNSILKRERELFEESWRLKGASFEATQKKGNKNKNFERSQKLQKRQDEVYKKQQFFMNYLKEMEKRK